MMYNKNCADCKFFDSEMEDIYGHSFCLKNGEIQLCANAACEDFEQKIEENE